MMEVLLVVTGSLNPKQLIQLKNYRPRLKNPTEKENLAMSLEDWLSQGLHGVPIEEI
jgi:hypothetical protein